MRGAPLIIELTDVALEVGAREASEWEEGPALRRETAAKQAELAAAELAKLSRRSGWGRWSIIQHLISYLLNNLQFSINNLHVTLHSPGPSCHPQPVKLGVKFDQLATTQDVRSLSAALFQLLGRVQQVRGWQAHRAPSQGGVGMQQCDGHTGIHIHHYITLRHIAAYTKFRL